MCECAGLSLGRLESLEKTSDFSAAALAERAQVAVNRLLHTFARSGHNPRKVPKQLTHCLFNDSSRQAADAVRQALNPSLTAGMCVPKLLSHSLLCAVAAKRLASVSPAAFLRQLEAVLQLALLLRHCSSAAVAASAGALGVLPPTFDSVEGFLPHFRAALSAFNRGAKVHFPAPCWSWLSSL